MASRRDLPRHLSYLKTTFFVIVVLSLQNVPCLLASDRIHHRDALSRAIIDAFPDMPTLIDFGFPEHLCGIWNHNYTRMHQQIRQASRDASPPSPDSPPVKFLTFDGLRHCDSLGETLMGLTSSFAVALLTNRSFLVRHACIPMAFEPALIDWQPTSDISMNESPPGLPFPLDAGSPPVEVKEGDVVVVDLQKDETVDVKSVFDSVEKAWNIRVVWNRELLVHMLKASDTAWAKELKEKGVRIPYAFGCFVRYLLRPKPEVWHRMQPFERNLRGDRVVSIGMHMRVFDQQRNMKQQQQQQQAGMEEAQLAQVMADVADPTINCAEMLENWWYPPTLNVKWLVISDSSQVKKEVQRRNETKIVTTEYEPWVPSSLVKSGTPPPADAPPDIPTVETFQQTVTEWLLLSSCNSFIVPASSFGRTAALYSLHPMSIYTASSCEPQSPVRVSTFGEGSKRQTREGRRRLGEEEGGVQAGQDSAHAQEKDLLIGSPTAQADRQFDSGSSEADSLVESNARNGLRDSDADSAEGLLGAVKLDMLLQSAQADRQMGEAGGLDEASASSSAAAAAAQAARGSLLVSASDSLVQASRRLLVAHGRMWVQRGATVSAKGWSWVRRLLSLGA